MSKLNLTPLARHEAYLRLYGILTSLPIAKSAKKVDEDLKLERKLAAELLKQWRETYNDALKEIFPAIPDFISKKATKLIQDGLLDALGAAFGNSKSIREQIKEFITKAYSSAKNKWVKPELKDILSLPDKKAISVLSRHNCFWLGEHYEKHISPKIAELTQEALDEGIGRDALAERLKQTLGGVAPEDYKYWDVAASSALVRARSFGAISGMEEAGITEYEILAMGDERTCPICGELNGRIFSVADTRKVIDKALDLTDPEAFKEAMPWHTKPPIGKSSSQLTADGQSLPPFHGRCRCTLVMINDSENITLNSFPEVQPDSIFSFNNDTRIVQIQGHSLPVKGLSNWKYDRLNAKMEIQTRRFFNCNGEPVLDVDFNDHGKPKAHPYGAHAHHWKNGIRKRGFRELKRWEQEMVQEEQKHIIQKYVRPDTNKVPEPEYLTVEQFIYVFNVGGEIEFRYKGHDYAAANYDTAQAWEAHNEKSYSEFKDVDDLLDNFKLHTGERLRDVMQQIELEFAPVWPD